VSIEDFSPDEWADPFEIDTTVAHPARRYNYWLGGTENFEADRISGESFAAALPSVRTAAIENRRFLGRVVTFLVQEAGVRQFLDIGTGIPSADNVHEVAQSIAPESRVVYADNDPIVLAHSQRLLASATSGPTAYIQADLREPEVILAHSDLRKTLDLSEPVGLMLIAIGHFIEDSDDPYRCVSTLADALPRGSYLAMSHGTKDFMSAEIRAAVEAWTERERGQNRDPFRPRDRAEFARFFAGMDLVPPGIQPVPEWRSDLPPDQRASAAEAVNYGAVARIS
jgi:hypothetical protein